MVEVLEELRGRPELDGLRIEPLHGRIPVEERETTMRAFAAGEVDVLVATTVVEVGVDVPNATLMVLLDADRFGISQLHQLRGPGRPGRGGVAVPARHPGRAGTPAHERLEAVAATLDGFELARVDLEQRREGDVLGKAQSGGRSSLKLLRVLRDEDLIEAARHEAVALVAEDPDAERHPGLAGGPRRAARGGQGRLPRAHVTRGRRRMTRIIAGSAGGRRIETPKGSDTRPTSDRVREALFGALEARDVLDGAAVLDLFAGSGALGLEAASRGAASVVLVDSARAAVEVARRNAAALGLPGVRVVQPRRCVTSPGQPRPVDLALLDPPYAVDEEALAAGARRPGRRALAPGAVVVVERSARSPQPRWPAGWTADGARRYGDTAVWTALARLRS